MKFSLKRRVEKVSRKRSRINLRIQESNFVLLQKAAADDGAHADLDGHRFPLIGLVVRWAGGGGGGGCGEADGFKGGMRTMIRATLTRYTRAPENMLNWRVGSALAISPPIKGPMMKPRPLTALKVPRTEARSLLGVMSAR